MRIFQPFPARYFWNFRLPGSESTMSLIAASYLVPWTRRISSMSIFIASSNLPCWIRLFWVARHCSLAAEEPVLMKSRWSSYSIRIAGPVLSLRSGVPRPR